MKKYIPRSLPHYDEQDSSFAHREITVFDEDHTRRIKLVLPASEEVDDLVKQRSAAANLKADAHSEAQMEVARKAQAERSAAKTKLEAPTPFVPLEKKKKLDRAFVDRARADLLQKFEEQSNQYGRQEEAQRGSVQTYAWDEPLKMLELALGSPDDQLHARDIGVFEGLKKRGNFRRVFREETQERSLDAMRALRNLQPHFSEVIDFVQGQILMGRELARAPRIPPILIVGSPGVGKTHFTLELSRGLERFVHRHSFDASHTSSSLTGSARNWANTSVGLVFKAVCMSDRADPVILLDEIDKSDLSRHCNALAPLHSLLEPLTADKTTDISVGIEFDASHVSWVATANDLSLVSPAILSRFRVFEIKAPTAEQAIELAHHVAVFVHVRFKGFEFPSRRVITALAPFTPREQTHALEHAFASALVNDRKHLMVRDLPAEMLDLNSDTQLPPRLH